MVVLAAAVVLGGCRPAGGVTTSAEASRFSPTQVALGDSVYHAATCAQCHGPDGGGAINGPSLRGPVWRHVNGSYGDFIRIIVSGIPRSQLYEPSYRFPMPARGGVPVLTDEQISAVAAYLSEFTRR